MKDRKEGFVGHPFDRIVKALKREFPTANTRIISDDSVAITDADGDDWELILRGPSD